MNKQHKKRNQLNKLMGINHTSWLRGLLPEHVRVATIVYPRPQTLPERRAHADAGQKLCLHGSAARGCSGGSLAGVWSEWVSRVGMKKFRQGKVVYLVVFFVDKRKKQSTFGCFSRLFSCHPERLKTIGAVLCSIQ